MHFCPHCQSGTLSNGEFIVCIGDACSWAEPVDAYIKSLCDVKCDQGPNKGKPGPCPGVNSSSGGEDSSGNTSSEKKPAHPPFEARLTAADVKVEQHTQGRFRRIVTRGFGKAKKAYTDFKEKLDKITDVPLLKQVKGVMGFVGGLTTKFTGKVMERYGKAGGVAVLSTGQIIGWGAFYGGIATMGVPLWLPGASIWGSLPGAAVAEVTMKIARSVRGSGEHKSLEEMSPKLAAKLWKQFLSELAKEYVAKLREEGVIPQEGQKSFRAIPLSPFRFRKSLCFDAKCQEGPNKGKPGRCPKAKTDGAAKRKPVSKVKVEKKPLPVKKGKADIASVKKAIEEAISKKSTPKEVADVVKKFGELTNKDMLILLKERGRGSAGVKAKLVERLKEILLSGLKKHTPPTEKQGPPRPEPESEKQGPPRPEQSIDLQQTDPDNPVARSIRTNADAARVLKSMAKLKTPEIAEAESAIEQERNAYSMFKEVEEAYGKKSPKTDKERSKWYEFYRKAEKLKPLIADYRNKCREEFKKLMTPKNPPEIEVAYYEGIMSATNPEEYLFPPFVPDEKNKKAIDNSLDFIKSITEGRGIKQKITFRESVSGRAYFSAKYTEKASENRFLRLVGVKDKVPEPEIGVGIYVDEHEATKTNAHELGHFIDEMKPGARKMIEDFLTYRLKDEQPVDMGDIPGGETMKGEMVRKDHFDRYFNKVSAYYVGKEYKGKDGKVFATEILSMGVEALYNDPAGFMEKDPEYAQFVIGILRM